MQLTAAIQILAALTVVSAAPFVERSDSSNVLSKRATVFDIDCGGKDSSENLNIKSVIYSSATVRTTYNHFVSVANLPNGQKPAAGTRAYPQQYGNNQGVPSDPDVVAALNSIPGCETGQAGFKFYKYPLADLLWNGSGEGDQGPHRIISIAQNVGQGGTRTYTYCAAMTHLGGNGGSDPSFRACKNA